MSNQIRKFVILGERCSGTNFLEEVIKTNFDIEYTIEYGNKHFFCFNNYEKNKTDDILFIGIIRNPIYWLNSFSKELYHIPEINRKSLKNFLFNEFYSVEDEVPVNNNSLVNNGVFLLNNKPYTHKYNMNKQDLNYITGNKYKNIFEMRKLKNDYLINIMPTKVKNYLLINYEDLLYNFEKTLFHMKTKFDLIQIKEKFENVKKYKKSETYDFVIQRLVTFPENVIKMIWLNLDVKQEASLGYFMGTQNEYFKKKALNSSTIV
jgi:hypothetical protein